MSDQQPCAEARAQLEGVENERLERIEAAEKGAEAPKVYSAVDHPRAI